MSSSNEEGRTDDSHDEQEDEEASEPARDGGGKVRFSPDGRFAYRVCHLPAAFVAVDLVLHTRVAFAFAGHLDPAVLNFVVVSPRAVVVHEYESLWLLRLNVAANTCERVDLERCPPSVGAYAFTEIRGTSVDVRRAVLGWTYADRIRFARLDVDAGRLQVDGEVAPEDVREFRRLSDDGRSLYALGFDRPRSLHVLDTTTRTWRAEKMTGAVDQMTEKRCLWTRKHAFLCGYTSLDDRKHYAVFRCDLERREWTKLPLSVDRFDRVAPIVNADTGDADGLLFVWTDPDDRKTEIRRLMLKSPDSLVLLAATALRRSRLHVDGEWGFHGCMQKTRYNRLLPPLYPNMTPLARPQYHAGLS
ncbi:hypothetical protein M3Y99_00829000 [Aphelenchoides fujianensis]|nr:hypothetical protein M3Y99_00829000 [Aphelenchoides fujianensis]